MNATISPATDFGTDEAFDVTVSLGRPQHVQRRSLASRTMTDLRPVALPRQANRAWPTASGLIYVVDSYPGLAQLAKTLLELEGYSACAFEDRATAWQAFAFASPRPALLITDNLDGDVTAMELLRRCRSIEPKLKTLLVDHQYSLRPTSSSPDLTDSRLPLPYSGPLLIREVRRLFTGNSFSLASLVWRDVFQLL